MIQLGTGHYCCVEESFFSLVCGLVVGCVVGGCSFGMCLLVLVFVVFFVGFLMIPLGEKLSSFGEMFVCRREPL